MMRLFLAAWLALGASTMLQAQMQPEGDAEAGSDKIQVCLACHGETGNTVTVPGAAKIGAQNENYLFKQLQDIKSGEREVPLMAGMLQQFDEQDMADIAAYYAAQEAPQGVAEASALPLGEDIYRAGNPEIGAAACAACHLPTGEGIAGAGYPRLSGQDPDYTETQLRAFRSGERQNDVSSVMRSISARLNDEEISALASYISGLRN